MGENYKKKRERGKKGKKIGEKGMPFVLEIFWKNTKHVREGEGIN